jgi:serine phosphatase RsbU (regulator of sigma subunit)
LVLFTDGIVEAIDRKNRLFGTQGVRAALERLSASPLSLEAMVDGLVTTVQQHLEGSDFEDDFTVLAIERHEDG